MRKFVSAIVAATFMAASAPAYADMAEAQQAYANGDFTRAVELWQDEASAGDADAAWYVGNMFVDGLGVGDPDPELATTYYQMAIDQDHVEAMVSLGLLFAQGRGVRQNYHRAMNLLYQAALEEHPVAMVEIANYFLDGVPNYVEKSEGHAFEWYGLAARQGVVLAQLRFGQMHYLGIGAPQDQEEGLMWIAVAREVALSRDEPYWSYRVYPLDDAIRGAEGDEPHTLRSSVIALYDEYVAEVSPEVANDAQQAALAWIADRAN